jgi:putative ABC transport system permease protein
MIAEKLPEVKNYCFMNSWNKINRFDIQDEMGNKHKFDESTIFAHENIIDMFKPQIIAGNARQAFTEPAKAMLTESIAKKFFGTQDPLGKTFSFHIYPDIMITVVAVCKDFPSNCSLTNKQYI